MRTTFGPMLRRWRTSRGYSQDRLARDAEVSARHVSFLETGRSAPSREMVLVLASALDMPLRERNAMLASAGFTPAYTQLSAESAGFARIRRAIEYLIAAMEPYPALVLDREWNLQSMNAGAARLLRWLSGDDIVPIPNAFEAAFHPDGIRRRIANWNEIAPAIWDRLEREVLSNPGDEQLAALRDRIATYPGVSTLPRTTALGSGPEPFVVVHFRHGERDARFFTTITSLGTPLDATAQEVRIEAYLAADESTEAFVQSLAREESSKS